MICAGSLIARFRATSWTTTSPAPIPKRRCAPIATIWRKSKFANVFWLALRTAICRKVCSAKRCRFPLALGPIGMTGMAHRDGEIAAARAAEKAGIPYTLSTFSICSIEDVAAAVQKPFWFQLYFMKDRGFIADLIARARAANCSALVLTADLQVLGQRHRDVHNGITVPPRIGLATIAHRSFETRRGLRECCSVSANRSAMSTVAFPARSTCSSYMAWINSQFDQALSWEDVGWVRERWPGKLIIKGILDVEDAREAVKSGADAIVVSNHGGRQLDGAPSSISMLPRIADAVGVRDEDPIRRRHSLGTGRVSAH